MSKDKHSKQGNNYPGEKSIFTAIREAHPLVNYCEDNGINLFRIGSTYRTNSPFTNAGNAFSINISSPDLWHDYSVVDIPNHGDVLELCAWLNHNGDKKQAMYELAPEGYRAGIDRNIRNRQEIKDKIQRACEALKDYPRYVEYLHSRGVDDEQIKRLKIGVEVISNMLSRLLIPRFNYDGAEILYYKTRRDPERKENDCEPKYSGARLEFNPSLRNVPLGLQTLSKKGGFLVLTEGDFDYMSFEHEGFAVLASGGGAFSRDMWHDVIAHAGNFEEFVLALDNDEDGKRFTRTIAENLFELTS